MYREAANVIFCGFLIALSLFALNDLAGLKKSAFDYLASSSVPIVLCWVLIGLAAIVLARSVVAMVRGSSWIVSETEVEIAPSQTGRQGVLISAISVAYVLTIVLSLLPYAISTTLMLGSCMWILSPTGKKNGMLIVGLAIGIGGGCAYVFTELLPLPFPGF